MIRQKIHKNTKAQDIQNDRIRHILRLVDKFGLKELEEISEQYAHRDRNLPLQISDSNVTTENVGKKSELKKLGRFDAAEFVQNHKENCRLQAAEMEQKAAQKELLGIAPDQAIIQYRCKLIK